MLFRREECCRGLVRCAVGSLNLVSRRLCGEVVSRANKIVVRERWLRECSGLLQWRVG